MNLNERLQRPDWEPLRQRVFATQGRRCAVCGVTYRLEIHHLHYRTLGNESISDFRVLCHKHHKRGRYSAFEIQRDRKSLAWAKALSWIICVPFRLLCWAYRALRKRNRPEPLAKAATTRTAK